MLVALADGYEQLADDCGCIDLLLSPDKMFDFSSLMRSGRSRSSS
jgi:hypothetical protein